MKMRLLELLYLPWYFASLVGAYTVSAITAPTWMDHRGQESTWQAQAEEAKWARQGPDQSEAEHRDVG